MRLHVVSDACCVVIIYGGSLMFRVWMHTWHIFRVSRALLQVCTVSAQFGRSAFAFMYISVDLSTAHSGNVCKREVHTLSPSC